jgi:hypothetical protein
MAALGSSVVVLVITVVRCHSKFSGAGRILYVVVTMENSIGEPFHKQELPSQMLVLVVRCPCMLSGASAS